jgi:hypothetical protein
MNTVIHESGISRRSVNRDTNDVSVHRKQVFLHKDR